MTVTANGNAVDAPDKQVTVSGTAAGGNGVATPLDVTLTIADDEALPTVTLTLSPTSISESGGVSTVTATLSGVSSATVTVTVGAAAGTGVVAADFTLSSTETLTIASGDTTSAGAVTVTANGNTVDSPDKQVTVSGTAAGGNNVANPSSVTLTLTDDDGLPTVTLSLSPMSVSESGGVSTVTATLSGVSSAAVTVTVGAAAVAPAVSGDYTLSSATTLTIAAGSTTSAGAVTVTANGNAVDSPDKQVTVSGTAAGGNGVAAPLDVTLTIADDDALPTVTLILSPTSISENGGVSTVTATLSGVSSAAVTVTVAAAGTGAVAADFTLSSATTLTIAAGDTTSAGAVTVTANGNAVDSPDKQVTVSGTAAGGNNVANPSSVTLTLTDDDGLPTVTLSLSPMSISESGGVSTVTATLSGVSSAAVTVTVGAAAVAPAVSGDFTLSSATTLTIAAGSTTSAGAVKVTANGNTVDSPDKQVTVSGTAAGGNNVANPSSVTLTLTDDDELPTVTLALSPMSISESGGVSTVTATLSGVSSAAVTVTVGAAAVAPAVSGDYTLSSATTLTIAAGSMASVGTVTIAANDNKVDAANKRVTVSGTAMNARAAADSAPVAVTAAELTITDDDEKGFVLTPAELLEVTEGGAPVAYTVALTSEPVGAVAVAVAADNPFLSVSPAGLTFTARDWEQAQTVTVTARDDGNEDAEPSSLSHRASGGGYGGVSGSLPVSVEGETTVRVSGGASGTTTYFVEGRRVTVTVMAGAPEGIVVDFAGSGALARDVVLRFAPPAAGVPLGSARFGLGETSDRRTVVDVTAEPVPSGGLEICLPVTASLRAEAGERVLRLLHYGGSGWEPVAGSRDDAARGRVCASGVVTLSPFAAGYDDPKPTFGDAQMPPQRYRKGTEIDPLTLPAATGGDGSLTYTLSPALPEGLEYTAPVDATSGGTLTGTPAVSAQAAAYTVTVTDSDGDTATLEFTLEVEQELKPTFGNAQVPPQRYMQDTEIARLALPAATGGNGPLVYALTGPGPASVLALPEGLAWSESAVTRPTRPGALAGTPTVPAPPAAWTLTATDANGDSATLGFTIEVVDRLQLRLKGVNEAILPDLSRAMTASTMDAVTGRIGQALSPGGATTAPADVLTAFAGILQANEKAIEDGTWSWKQELDGRTFALALSGAGGARAGGGFATGTGTAAGARVTLWGAGDYRNLSGAGKGSAVDWDGHLFGGHLGLDARFGAGGLAGLALSMSEGRFDYTDTSAYALGEKVEGEYESRMRSAHPYLGWSWPAGMHAWVSLGYGRGDITILDGEAGRQTSDSRLRSAAAGGSVRVLSGEGPGVFGPMTVDLKGEAWTARLEVEDNGEGIAGLEVTTHRVRVAAEGSREFALSGGLSFTPSVELGMRFDGGDGETGAGVELGGGVDYAYPAWGLSADVTGRVLLAHQGETEDWSVGGAVRLEPASGLGLSLSVAPSYGDTASGLSRLWEHGVAGSGAGATEAGTTDASPTARLDTEMGYGLAAFAGVLTPYGGFGLSEGGTRGYRLGARFLLGPAFEMGLEGERKESRTDPAEHGLTLSGRMRW